MSVSFKWAASVLVTIALQTALTSPAQAQSGRQTDGRVSVNAADYKPVFLDTLRFYPGTAVVLRVEPRIDVMRYMYEERHCWSEWFGGVWCKWVDTSRGSGLPVAQTPLDLRLLSPAMNQVATLPQHQASPYDPEPHLADNANSFTLPLDANAMLQGEFTRGYQLDGRLAPRYGAGADPVARQICSPHRNGQYCSQGQFIISIQSVDVSVREAQLAQYLTQRRSFPEISSPNTIDFFLRNDVSAGVAKPSEARLRRIARLLLDHTRNFYSGAMSGQPDRGQILELASSFSPDDVEIRTEMVAFHIDSGNLAVAKTANDKLLKDLNAAYVNGAISDEDLRELARGLHNAGAINLAENGAVRVSDVEMAAGAYQRSVEIWEDYAKRTKRDRRQVAPEMAQAYVDQARVLSLVKTPETLARAAASLRKARSLAPRLRTGAVVGVTPDGRQAATIDLPLPFASALTTNVNLQFLPPGFKRVLDADPETGAVLAEGDVAKPGLWRLGADGSLERLAAGESVVLRNARLLSDGVAGFEPGGALVLADDRVTSLTASPAGTIWAAARSVRTLAWVAESDLSKVRVLRGLATTDLDVGPGVVRGLDLSRDGQRLAVLQDASGQSILKLFKIDAGAGPIAPPIAVVDLGAPEDLAASFRLSADGAFAVLRDESRLWVVNAQGDVRRMQSGDLFPKSGFLIPLRGSRFLAAAAGGSGVERGAVVDANDLFAAGKPPGDNAPKAPPAAVLKFPVPLSSADFVPSRYRCDPQGACELRVQARSIAGGLKMYAANGDVKASANAPAAIDVNTLVALQGGRWLAHRSPDGTSLQFLDLSGAPPASVSAPAGSTLALVPVRSGDGQPRHYVVASDAAGQVTSIRFFSAPGAPAMTMSLPAGAWRRLVEPAAPLTPAQDALRLIEVVAAPPPPVNPAHPPPNEDQTYAATTAVAVRLVSLDGSGGMTTRSLNMRAPHRVITVVGDLILERRPTGLAWADPAGHSEPLAPSDCLDGFCTAPEVLRTSDTSIVVSNLRKVGGTPRLDVRRWNLAGGRLDFVWNCATCTSSEPARIADIGAIPTPPFALSASNDTLLLPLDRDLGLAPSGGANVSERVSSGRPLIITDQGAVIQKDAANFEVWATSTRAQ